MCDSFYHTERVRNMVINYPDYLSPFTLIFYSIIKNILIISRQWDMSRNGTSAIYKSTYYSLGLVLDTTFLILSLT
jgi:hypothetical protein